MSRVRDATGSRRVDLVGHSQGGMMPRYYLKFLNGAAKVDDLVGIAPSHHGTTMADGGPGRLSLPGVRAAGGGIAVPYPAQPGR